MLTQMRALSQNWIGRSVMAVVLAFIIVSFAIWGIGDRFTNFNASELAKVGSETITVDAYRNAYQTQLQQLEREQRRAITNEEARRLGLDRSVLARLLRDAILDQQARALGLAVGDTEIAKSIMADDMFKGQDGKFDRARFEALMRDNGLTEARYVREQRRTILRQDVGDAVTGNLDVPKILEDAIHRYKSEVRDFDFFVLPPDAAGAPPTPTDAQLQTYYDSHPTLFTAPEYRKLNVLSVVPANLVKPGEVTDADAQKRYDDTKAQRFIVPEKRTVEQLVFPDAKAAQAAKAKLDGGESFDKLLADEKKSPSDVGLGTVAKSEIADPAVADAAFALPAGGTSQPIKGQFGTVLVHVTKVEPMRQQPFMEVAAQLKDELAIIRAKATATQLRDKIEDARTSGKTLAEAAAGVGLKPRTIDAIDAKGLDRAGRPVEGLVDGPDLLKAAFASDIGADTEMLQTPDGGDVWYEVAGISPAHRLSLAEVKGKVTADWQQAEIAHRLSDKAAALVAALDGGKSLATLAAENGKAQIMQARNVSRAGAPNLPANVAAAAFSVPVGKAGMAGQRTEQGEGRMIFEVTAARVPPVDPKDEEFKKILDQAKPGFEDDVLVQYLAKLQGEIGVKINAQALQTALGDSNS